MGAKSPMRSDATKELTRETRSQAAQTAGCLLAMRAICCAVNRGNARDPVNSAKTVGPPMAFSSASHSGNVLLSAQIGQSVTAKQPCNASFKQPCDGSLPSACNDSCAPAFQ